MAGTKNDKDEKHEGKTKMNDKTHDKKKERMWTLHPGEILREEYLKPLRLTPYRLARELHVPVPRINDIVLEKRAISADTAVRLAKFFGTTESFWLGMQADYDAHQARKRLQKELAGISRFRPSKVTAA
ncbi:MAG: HigA family addiction module antitoxin [Candidatus Korobacteraceae bacterium]